MKSLDTKVQESVALCHPASEIVGDSDFIDHIKQPTQIQLKRTIFAFYSIEFALLVITHACVTHVLYIFLLPLITFSACI